MVWLWRRLKLLFDRFVTYDYRLPSAMVNKKFCAPAKLALPRASCLIASFGVNSLFLLVTFFLGWVVRRVFDTCTIFETQVGTSYVQKETVSLSGELICLA